MKCEHAAAQERVFEKLGLFRRRCSCGYTLQMPVKDMDEERKRKSKQMEGNKRKPNAGQKAWGGQFHIKARGK